MVPNDSKRLYFQSIQLPITLSNGFLGKWVINHLNKDKMRNCLA